MSNSTCWQARLLTSVAAFIALILTASAEDKLPVKGLDGLWEGPLQVGPFKPRVEFQIIEKQDGSMVATVNVVELAVKNFPCGDVIFSKGKLSIDIPDPGWKARFDGTLSEDGRSIAGDWKQDGESRSLVLRRVEKSAEIRRPQTPQKPYPYQEEELTFYNPFAKLKLAGTLTLPKGNGPFPAVALVAGSGPNDRDESIFLHKPFLVLADHLTRLGIAVLRFDKRGVGKSEGKFEGAISSDFATDAYAAIEYLKTRKEIDPKRIGMIGHSEGALIASLIAADHPSEVEFIVLLAAPGLPGRSMAAAQFEDLTKDSEIPKDAVELTQRLLDSLIAAVAEPGTPNEKKSRLTIAVTAFAAKLTDRERKLLGADRADWASLVVDRFSDPWMQFILAYDPRPTLKRVRCPVLALTGEKDVQVRAKDNLPAIAAALTDGGNKAITVKNMAGLNHQFQNSVTGMPSEYIQIEETFAPVALSVISDWIKGLEK